MNNKEVKLVLATIFIMGLISSVFCFNIDFRAGLISFFGYSSVLVVMFSYLKYKYSKLSSLSDYIRKMANGDFSFDIRDNREGQLSILKNEIYKLGSILREQSLNLSKEKESLKTLLSNISHQLKTPLSSLVIMIDLIENENLPKDKKQEFILNIHKSLNRMEWLVVSLMKIAKFDAGTVDMRSEKINILGLIEKALEPLLIFIELSEINLDINKNNPYDLFCDINWTAEALSNIIKNAIEHCGENKKVKVEFGDTPIYSWISVTNNNSGLSKKDLPHIFERFYKCGNSKKDSFGIGLSLSMLILKSQDGGLEVSLEEDKSCTFTLKFYKTVV